MRGLNDWLYTPATAEELVDDIDALDETSAIEHYLLSEAEVAELLEEEGAK